jgi:3-oxoacyl-[acyl-carrier protein] reductase
VTNRTVAVVTGAARGGGYGAAVALAERFTDVVLIGRSTDEHPNPRLSGTLEETRAQVEQRGATGNCLRADLSRRQDRAEVAEMILSCFDGCDLLVNNAAYNPVGPFLDSSFGKWDATFAVNVTAAAELCHSLVPSMIRRGGGRVINVGSLAATTEFGICQLAYAASKAALERFTVALAVELSDTGVAVNNIRVDEAIRSEALAKLVSDKAGSARSVGYSPEEFGAAVAWLSEQPTTFTGNVLTFAALRDLGALPPIGTCLSDG